MIFNKYIITVTVCFLVAANAAYAQKPDSLQKSEFIERIQSSPESVFSKFRDAGMSPINHVLTDIEKKKLDKAFSILPPLHQNILKEHLYSISFMGNMPNTALTSPIETSDSTKMFNITFRAEIINETISKWATWKENTYYIASKNNEYEVVIDAGKLDAIVYVLLHEATHIVDAVLNMTPHTDDIDLVVTPTSFTIDVWDKMNQPQENATNTVLETTRFRSGKPLPISSTPEIYKALQESPFASLYSMASWHEDLAELVTIYHLTSKMNQPFKIVVKKNGVVVSTYKPFTNKKVLKRQPTLQLFYAQ